MPKTDQDFMALAVTAAKNGQGAVEPNPMVGCVIVAGGQVIGIGWHEKFGGPHAEINAIDSVTQKTKLRSLERLRTFHWNHARIKAKQGLAAML